MNTTMNRREVLQRGLGLAGILLLAGCGVQVTPPDAERLNTLAVTQPGIIGCASWKAAPPKEAITVLSARPTRLIVHHTNTANTSDTSLAHAHELARSIQSYHQNNNGWIDSGQQFTITRGGYVLEGRHRSLEAAQNGNLQVVGAHCPGQNEVAVGIENEGNYQSVAPPSVLYNQLVTLCAWLCDRYGIVSTEIYGHRDFYATACPGDVLYSQLPKLRSDVAAKRGQVVRVWPTVRSGFSGERVKSVQYLLNARGQSVAVDGQYGSGTAGAVSRFQAGAGLTQDGVVGSLTWERLILTVRRGDLGSAVQGVQSQLASKGYALSVDGNFGPGTESAVKSFQSSRGLTSDGIVGPATWHALVS
ncbi:peptidoglycan recognition protein family protein [Deinococcus peraridilitoris]|uniref:Putative peptidoglycan-binding domain-containing protein n=1 Tax=Deinococcus peraridilitoris (strain DSM 19664 / LMG 22246 / CIP 109416 / KR-200) TaxID=937777 RepID=K9ZZN8_DEIPD|nr:N-acetylmuramoyl-L-alanine amidase [Deinococcus peraridilitoris]AFZ66225.1 putative peptidoglycan-binding domain-containing protein [Deinococcus peraridilitoris DSM 19664]